jgi:hypothetical protein
MGAPFGSHRRNLLGNCFRRQNGWIVDSSHPIHRGKQLVDTLRSQLLA